MPLTTTTRGPADPHRRSVLTGAAALGAAALLAGCSEHRETDGDKRARAGERLRARAARDSDALLDHYEATLAAHAGLAGRLAPLRAEVALHARAFGAPERRATTSPTPSASSAPASPSSPPSSGSSASPKARTDVPKDEKAALG
ncbi:hypothetical protein ACFU99_37565, partial [Streptomyces sp. NPDC057654]|uniref:hypothetical protein n=1 Tax=Streptomyces sp. NPDC057654 TaxID=3346196 RepID=UPI0036804BD6